MKNLNCHLRSICLLFAGALAAFAAAPTVHVWEKHELTLTAAGSSANPYTDVTVWADVTGPNFKKRVYGFWDGGMTFRVRLVATAPGTWTWKSGSTPADSGLAGKSGSFTAVAWTEEEKQQNPARRGFLKATANQHAIEHADGTPFFVIGDTWYPATTNRFKWYDDDSERPLGPGAGFKDYVRYRKAQGYNSVLVIAAFPAWATDGQSDELFLNDADRTCVRSAWIEYGTKSAKNMENEGGRAFQFPGKVPGYENVYPDMDRINPDYFRYMDRKVDYLNQHGFIPFIEIARRDTGMSWKKFYKWPDSYSRYIQYMLARYQAYNIVLSPIHFDIDLDTILPSDYSDAIALAVKNVGLPYGTLLTANANPSTVVNFGENSWVTLHQMGNEREHDWYWYLTEIFHLKNPKPALNGEPYYSGYKDVTGLGDGGYKYGADGGSERDNQYIRSTMYGSFLSGGFAGHIYGAEGIWGADIEPAAPVKMWDAFQWRSGAELQYVKTFAFSIGRKYQDLVPIADLVSPNKTHTILGFEGWAFCARTPDKNVFLAYFEKGCPKSQVRSARPLSFYKAQWFDPRNGTWLDAGTLRAGVTGLIELPGFPGDLDWGLRLEYSGPSPRRRDEYQ